MLRHNAINAYIVVPHTQGAQVRITQFYLPLPRKRSPDGDSPDWGCGHLIAAYCSFIYPKKTKGWPGWLTYSGRFTNISGYPSAAGRAQDSKSSPLKDRRSTTVPRNQMRQWFWTQQYWMFGVLQSKANHKLRRTPGQRLYAHQITKNTMYMHTIIVVLPTPVRSTS